MSKQRRFWRDCSPEPSLLTQAISTKFAWRGPFLCINCKDSVIIVQNIRHWKVTERLVWSQRWTDVDMIWCQSNVTLTNQGIWFIHDIALRRGHMIKRPSSMYETSWSKMVYLRKISGKCKYYHLYRQASRKFMQFMMILVKQNPAFNDCKVLYKLTIWHIIYSVAPVEEFMRCLESQFRFIH